MVMLYYSQDKEREENFKKQNNYKNLKKDFKKLLTNKYTSDILNVSKEREEIKMKEIYDFRFKYRIDGWKNFVDTSIWKHVRYLTPEEAKTWNFTIKTFEELVDLVRDDLFMNAEISKNFFRKTVVRLKDAGSFSPVEVTAKNFKPIEVRCIYNKMSVSMKELAEELDSDSFCEYLKDRGITKI